MVLRVKRVHDNPEEADGERILVDRIWPRGISKDKARLSDWRKDLAPSNELREWFGHDPDCWEGFKDRYCAELEEAGKMEDLRDLAERAGGRRTSRSSSAPRTQNTTTPVLWKPSSGRSRVGFGQGKALKGVTGRGPRF
jgi:uncharacterized protein YeaO (DUF488 family)